ncbi:protein artichoke [Phlebotomus argentipes]|uniref:protein artichoke n=1 Tax=Phlebotomus argentipes TaxID=94469 RepID=UPI002893048D|nr:protein artichoke [Phlebotomus argentipes]
MLTMFFVTLALLATSVAITGAQRDTYCPPQEIILPCRCSQRGDEVQIWCSHSDLPRVLTGIKSVAKMMNHRQIDELILENNLLPSFPGRAFSPLRVLRLMLRHNGLERLSSGWLNDLEDSLVEVFIVERNLRSVPIDSLVGLRKLEAVTIQSESLKRAPDFSNLPRLRYVNIQSASLIELSPMGFRQLINLDTVIITGSGKLNRLEAGLFHDLPRLKTIDVSNNGINWIHLRALARLPQLKVLQLSGNRITDAGMVGRAIKDLSNLEVLKLDSNRITTLGEGSFVDLPSLKELHLNSNAITEIHHGAFHRTPNLKIVHLESNYLRRVHPESFLQASGSGVELLHLQENEIGRIEELRSLLDALPRLKFLDLSHNKLEVIPFGALRGHGTLEQLYLDNNMIRMIDRDAFMAMPGLRELRLKNNSLSDILPMPFWNLPGLKGLDLSENHFQKIEPQLLLGLPSLRRLDMSRNTLIDINPAAFMRTPMLETIDLSGNGISALHPATLRNLDRLFEIDISDNHLQEIIPGLPHAVEHITVRNNKIANLGQGQTLHLPNARMLDLSGNMLQRLPRGTFQQMPQLKSLNLAQNGILGLDDDSLAGLMRLEMLDLKDNRIVHLHEKSLATIPTLVDLNLQNNRLEEINSQLLVNLPQLKRLDLSRNSISLIPPETFRHTRSIEALDLSSNNMRELPPSLAGLSELREIDLSYNNLAELPPDIVTAWRSLEELRAASNKVTELRSGSFRNLPMLQYLDVSSNEMRSMQLGAIRNLPELQELVLADNHLQDLPERVFENLPSLQAVHLQQNFLSTIAPSSFYRTPSIVYLNLSTNNFRDLEQTGLRSVRSLEVLDLSNNGIRRVSSSPLRQLDWLVEINLDNNRICRVQGEPFASMPRLRVLSLRNNRMTSMPESTFRNLRTNIAILDLDGNPLDCSCGLMWYRSWLLENDLQLPGPRCRDGSMLRDIRLSRSDCQDLDSRNSQLSLPLTNEHGDIFARQIDEGPCEEVPYGEYQGNLPPSPEESDYFEKYVDYPLNETHPLLNTSSAPPLNLSHTILNMNPDNLRPPPPPPGPGAAFTFFGMPLTTLGLGRLWGQSRGNTERSDNVGSRGRGRVQVYRPDDPELLKLLGKTAKKPPLPDPGAPVAKESPQFYRPYFQTPFHEPAQVQTGGFVPMLPGVAGGFKPISDPFNATNSTSIEGKNSTSESSWPEDFHEEVPLVTESPRRVIVKGQPVKRGPILVEADTGETSTGVHDEVTRTETLSEPPVPTTTLSPVQDVISDLNDISRHEELDVPVPEDAASTYPRPQDFTKEHKFWENPPDTASSLSALVAPGAQQGVFKGPPGKSTITKVFTPAPIAVQNLPATEEYLHSQGQDNEVDSNDFVTSTSVVEPHILDPKSRSDMDWYYRSYNQTPTSRDYDFNLENVRRNSAQKIRRDALALITVATVHILRRLM